MGLSEINAARFGRQKKFNGTAQNALVTYFRSGWAFFLPFLACYLLYAWQNWPVINATAIASVPSLLRVFRFLLGTHVILGAAALYLSWKMRSDRSKKAIGKVLWGLAPWLFLTLFFWIPGPYLELPADPWAHFIRIGQWELVDHVTEHPAWMKFSYFLAFMFVDNTSLSGQLEWLNIYYTACCLLLCWQYYLLGRAVGLSHSNALIFVFLQVLLLGNNIFGFYRYYGISSSLFGQIGAVAFTRLAIALSGKASTLDHDNQNLPAKPWAVLSKLGGGLLLLVFIGFSHPQAWGAAALGGGAWAVRQFVEKGAKLRWILLFATVLFNGFVILWWPRQTAIELYRTQGWLNAWYGFNLFDTASPAFERVWVILGWPGALNCLAAIFLLRRNHLVGWLTLFPILALGLPFVAIPLANALSLHNANPANIITFHRMLFSIPPGLAFVSLGSELFTRQSIANVLRPANAGGFLDIAIRFGLSHGLAIGLFCFVTIPAGTPGFNRLYHVLVTTPDDLSIQSYSRTIDAISDRVPAVRTPSSLAIGQLVYAARVNPGANQPFRIDSYISASSQAPTDILAFIRNWPPSIFVPKNAFEIYTPISFAGYLSHHWSPQKVAFGAFGSAEFIQNAPLLKYTQWDVGERETAVYIHRAAENFTNPTTQR